MKRILLSISDGMVERNLLKTDFLTLLLAEKNVNIYLVCSDENLSKYLKEEYASFGVEVIFKPYGISKIDAVFTYIFQNSIHTITVKENQYNCFKGSPGREKTNWFVFGIFRILRVLGGYKIWRNIIRFAYKIGSNDYCKDLLLEIDPNLVFVPSIGPSDYKLIHQSKKMGFKTIQMIKSWDNLTSKTFVRIFPDHLIVHNEVMKKEAVELCDVSAGSIFVSGIPQFDYLFKNGDKLLVRRETFYSSIGIDHHKQVILYSVSGDMISPNDEDLIWIINRAIENKKIKGDVHIQVRLHPKYNSKFDKLSGLESVTLERPFSYVNENLKDWVFSKEDMVHWYNSIYHCAMVINVASSMAIDAATLDRPVICIGFDGLVKLPYERSVIRYYDRDHYRNLIDTQGVSLVKNERELINEINSYLEDTNKKKKERTDLVSQQCYKLDGNSSSRIANFLIKNLEN